MRRTVLGSTIPQLVSDLVLRAGVWKRFIVVLMQYNVLEQRSIILYSLSDFMVNIKIGLVRLFEKL